MNGISRYSLIAVCVILALLLSSCQFAPPPPVVTNTDAAALEANKTIYFRTVEEYFIGGNEDTLYELYPAAAADFYTGWWAPWKAAFPDMTTTWHFQMADGDLVMNHWTAHATHTGEFMGAPASGKEVAFDGMFVGRVEDGKIVEEWGMMDMFSLFQQLGFALTLPEMGAETSTEATESEATDGPLGFSTFGNGPEKVIAIHNFWDNQKQYEPVQPYLDPQAYTYAFVDLRGYGVSKDIPGEYTAEEAALDIIALADHLGWDRFHLVGHSMSGMIAQRVAVEAEDRVKSIVALTPVPASGTQLDEDTVGFFAGVVADRQSTYDYFRMAIPMFSESYAAFRADRSWESASPEVKLGYLRMWNNSDFSEETQGLETPILVVLGEYDEGFNQLVMPFWSDWYPNSEIITGANATHHITEDVPVFVASAIESFLAQHR